MLKAVNEKIGVTKLGQEGALTLLKPSGLVEPKPKDKTSKRT